MNTKIVKLDINRNLYDTLTAKQGDTQSRFLLFQLLDGAIPFSLENRSVKVFATKPDGKEVFNDLIINDRVKGYCTLELTNQMLAVPGLLKLELMVIEGDKKLTTNVFYMDVKKSINSENAIVSTNEFSALLNGLASLNEYDNYKNEIAAARDGEVNLLTKVKKIDEQLEHNVHNLNERINSFTKLEEGSTTGDAELIDGRIGANGVTYDNIGSAIREQFRNVNDFTNNFDDMQIPFEKSSSETIEWKLGRITATGIIQPGKGDTDTGMFSSKIYGTFNLSIIPEQYTKFTILVVQYNSADDTFVKVLKNNSYICGEISKEEGKYCRIYISTRNVTMSLLDIIAVVDIEMSSNVQYSIKIKPESISEKEIAPELLEKINNSDLGIATSEKVGGVKPVAKNSAMTQSVGIDAEGRLFTFPTSGESGIGKVINVCFFGAKGDGVTDDTIAIRNARDESKNTGLPLYFPSGTYLVHGTIQIFSNMIVCGDGANTV
ncbi:MAG: glycosyl hydrolase family 28-related protein, partial [Clostridium celatum]|nr:glycosyl hydrolase family 28-related protein [Clostridium celatum]